MNIVVIGAGGVGGYFGGKLTQSRNKVTFLVRGKHLDAIKNKGLQIKSIKGDFLVHPDASNNYDSIEKADLVILGVKSWQILGVAKEIKPFLSEKTMVLPLQNGADNADKLLSILPKGNVLAGLCKIVSKVDEPGVINHFAFEPEIIFGEYNDEKSERILALKDVFERAGFKNTLADDIHLAIWKKFQFITSVSGIAALTRVTFGEMRAQQEIRQIIFNTAQEIVAIANKKGIGLTEEDSQFVLKAVENSHPNTTASMQRDVMEGKPSELENFNGYIVKMGKELSIETPTNAFIYNCLLPQENIARKLV
ncbi:ketopantoate reductase family protein [Pseudofulvibacter geojedonensis]|uniref:2-dehydropantoate 2-reductase n=1 Tax=Pseudofulvibacter geojedonensis TaxID=1123758 RepID=A0ABW3I3P2_9FLAO